MRRVALTLAILAALTSCRGGAGEAGEAPVDVLGEQAVAHENEPNRGKCEVGNPDGVRCDKRNCKTNETGSGDCADFAKKCIDNGHHYNGTKDAGTCSRIL